MKTRSIGGGLIRHLDKVEQIDREEEEQYLEIVGLIKEDCAEEFLNKAKKLLNSSQRDLDKLTADFLWQICEYRSERCARVLLNGLLGFVPDLNKPFPGKSFNPLQYVAQDLSYSLAYIFVHFNAYPQTRTADGALPLDLALQSLRKMMTWTFKRSVYSLIIELCAPGMKPALSMVWLLETQTFFGLVTDAAWRYGSEGKLIELGALLLMTERFDLVQQAQPWLCYNGIKLRQHVIQQIVTLTNEECNSWLASSITPRVVDCNRKKEEMISVLLMLEIFDRREFDTLKLFRESDFMPEMIPNVVNMLEYSGFQLSAKDFDYAREISNFCGGVMMHNRIEKNSLYEVRDSEDLLDSASEDLINERADVASNSAQPTNEKLLPLHNELQKMSSNKMLCKWTCKESIFELIVLLCLPEMTALLKDIKLQVHNVEIVNELACYYALEDKPIELSILLMVACEKLKDEIAIQGEDNQKSSIFRQAINVEFAKLIDLKYRSMGRKKEEEQTVHQSCERRISSVVRSLCLLEIFEKSSSAIEGYLKNRKRDVLTEEVVEDVAKLLENSGFGLRLEDSQGNKVDGSSVDAEKIDETLKIIEMNRRSQPPIGFPTYKPPASTHNQIRGFSSGRHMEPPVVSSSLRSPCIFGMLNARFHSGYHKTLVPKGKELAVVVDQQIQRVQRKKQLASVALALRRVWRYF